MSGVAFLPRADQRSTKTTLQTAKHAQQSQRSHTSEAFHDENDSAAHMRPDQVAPYARNDATEQLERHIWEQEEVTGADLIES
eukprot:7113823-Pyramimonas_sp.AAC.1